MVIQANPSLMHMQALFLDHSESHAQAGAHVRVAHHPLLELPVAPFLLERADVTDKDFTKLKFREEAHFEDQNGNTRTPPFTIDDRDTITISIPTGAGNTALWAQVEMDPSGNSQPKGLAFIQSVSGEDTFLAERHGMPMAFSGTGLRRIVLKGKGTVVGLRWLNAADRQKIEYRLIDVLNLPHKGGRRYAQLSNWDVLCNSRRDDQSPRRRWLQDTTNAPPRNSAPFYSIIEEEQRISAFFGDGLEQPLDNLITGPVRQIQQVIHSEMTDASGDNISLDGSAEMKIQTLGLFLQGQIDPGMASYCGYKTLDTDRVSRDVQRLSLFRLRAYFREPDPAFLNALKREGDPFPILISQAKADGEARASQAIEAEFNEIAKGWLSEHNVSVKFDLERGSILTMGVNAVADHKALPEPLRRVSLDEPEHRHWLPSEPGQEQRVTETGVRNVVAGGTLAAQRREPPTGPTWSPINSEIKDGSRRWRALIAPGLPEAGPFDSTIPAAGLPDAFLSDPATGPDEFRVYVAQMDRFGRYSEWRDILGDAGPRPKPPRPVVRGFYEQPAIDTGSHQGTVTAQVALPDADALAPASFPLSHAVLTVKVDGAPFNSPITLPASTTVSIHPDANPPGGEDRRAVQAVFAGPVLPALAQKSLEVTAVWHDTEGQVSAVSDPLLLTLRDPYPPPQLNIPDVVLYSARPDATDQAWVERRWPKGGPEVRYAAYYTDENRLREYLRDVIAENGSNTTEHQQATQLLENLEGEENPAARATMLRDNNAMFPGYLYERLQDAIADVEGTNDVEMRHALSGSLKVLSGYKIIAEAAATSARPDLATLDTVFYAVPNSLPPARPVITAKQVESESGEPDLMVELTITLRPGETPAEKARIRRTRSGVIDPIRNPIIGEAEFGEVDEQTGLQTATLRDNGAALIAPDARLMPFVKYAWLAEAQGGAEPGSESIAAGGVAGLWSKPSAPTAIDVVPDGEPEPPTLVGTRGAAQPGAISGLQLNFEYPVDLVPGSLGAWTIVADRTLPGETTTRIVEAPASAGTTFSIDGEPGDLSRSIPLGTTYTVHVVDPLGRRSARVEHVVTA